VLVHPVLTPQRKNPSGGTWPTVPEHGVLIQKPGTQDERFRGSGNGGESLPGDPAYFAQVHIDPEAGTIAWPNGVDLVPEPLYEEARRNRAESASRTR
jgi:hypothetical protein